MNQKSLAKSLKVLTLIAALLAITSPALAQSRTWAQKSYDRDRGANYNHIFGSYKPLQSYQDPDFAEGAAMASPLYNPVYASYDVIVVINRSNVVDGTGKVLERGQRARVYVRAEALERLNQANMQNLTYDEASGLLFYFKTSTGAPGHSTPSGFFRVQGFSSNHKSSRYNNAPMPNAVQFNGNIFTHGVAPKLFPILGRADSHGCVRLETQRAGDLFHLIGHVGMGPVDLLDMNGNPIRDASGATRQVTDYKTLYIVR